MKPVIRITIALGLMVCRLRDVAVFCRSQHPVHQKSLCCFPLLRRQSVEIWIALGRFRSVLVQ